MRVTRAAATRTCAICERTLLVGEQALRFTPDGGEFVDVCPLCHDVALEHGWVREGSPTTPTVRSTRAGAARRLGRHLRSAPPHARRSRSRPSRSCGGSPRTSWRSSRPPTSSTRAPSGAPSPAIAKSLGSPKVTIVPLSGVNAEIVITVAWDISWYQYRVTPDSAQPVRLAERGLELDELEPAFDDWNAELARRRPAHARHRAGLTVADSRVETTQALAAKPLHDVPRIEKRGTGRPGLAPAPAPFSELTAFVVTRLRARPRELSTRCSSTTRTTRSVPGASSDLVTRRLHAASQLDGEEVLAAAAVRRRRPRPRASYARRGPLEVRDDRRRARRRAARASRVELAEPRSLDSVAARLAPDAGTPRRLRAGGARR